MSEEIKNKEFDKIVEQKYAQHTPPVPEHLYANIDKEVVLLESNSLRKRIFWYRWFTIALIFITSSIALFYQWENITGSNVISENQINENITDFNHTEDKISDFEESSEKPTEHVNQELGVNEIANASDEQSHGANSNPSSSITDKPDSKSEKKKTSPKSAINAYTFNKQKGTNNNNSSNIELVTKEERATIPNKSNNPTTSKNDAIDNTVQESKTATGVTPKTTDKNQTEDNNPSITDNTTKEPEIILEETTIQNDNKTNNTIIDKPSSSIKSTDTNETPFDNNEITEEISTATKAEEEQHIDSISPVATIIESDSSFKDTTSAVAVNETDSSSKKVLSKFSASLFIIPTLTNRGLSPSNNSHEIYDASETTEPGLSFGAALGYQLANKLTLNLGLSFHQFKSSIELNDQRPKDLPISLDPVNKNITIFSALGTVIISNIGNFEYAGDDQDDEDLDDEDDFASLNYKEEQEYLFLDIPLTIGYEFGKGKLKLILQTGIVTSLLIKDKAEISISNIQHPDVFVTANDFSQSNQLSFGGTFGIGAKFNFGKRFSILFMPSYNQTFTDINKDKTVSIKPSSIDFKTGLQYNF